MTTSIDDRARRAAEAIHDAVAGYQATPATIPAVARRRAVWRGAQLSAGAVAASAVIALVAMVVTPNPDIADTTTVPETTLPITTTSAPSPVTTEAPPPTVATTVPSAPPATTATTAADVTPPLLQITSPADGDRFTTEVVTFRGVTEPGASVVAAGKFAAVVDGAGIWSIDLVLGPGKNGASFVATDAAGNEARASIAVWLDAAEEPPKEEPPPVVKEFTANAEFGSCSETPPYDVYYGTATAGTEVTITSAYGSGSVVVAADGHWEKKVVFDAAPYGEPFLVTVKDHTGKTKTFEFVSYAGG